jgi:molybdopterin converting factor small subunit
MQVTVHYLAQMRRAAGCSSERVQAEDSSTLGHFLIALASRHGPPLRAMLLDEQSQPSKSLLFFVGEDHADLSRPLQDGDTVTILAPMAGG